MYESVALEKCKLWMNYISKTDVYPCGLVVNENNCWLGSSPDAMPKWFQEMNLRGQPFNF